MMKKNKQKTGEGRLYGGKISIFTRGEGEEKTLAKPGTEGYLRMKEIEEVKCCGGSWKGSVGRGKSIREKGMGFASYGPLAERAPSLEIRRPQ